MNYKLIDTQSLALNESPVFFEGAILAMNMACQAITLKAWLAPLCSNLTAEIETAVTHQINEQYSLLSANQFSLQSVLNIDDTDMLADFAEGFMTLWPMIEEGWGTVQLSDGTIRMLQALLTTWMLAIDETSTRQQMMESGIHEPPRLAELIDNIDLMINEVAAAADANLVGNRIQAVNPYKSVGRNDLCPCGSGEKFKNCCGE